MYYDANNLYGWAMSQSLPTGDFQWISGEEMERTGVRWLDPDGERGYVLEVDLEYPECLHDLHRDLPFCAEMKKPPGGKTPKLLTTLDKKEHYIVHLRVLQQALENGLRLTRVHRAISFKQSRWLKPYIDLNTGLRQCAKNAFEKDLFKKVNNIVYGRTLMDRRHHQKYELVANARKLERLVAKANFKDRTIYDENLALVHLAKVRVILDQPIYVGACVLDYSKWLMYDFHGRMQERYAYGRDIDLLYMDTDSFIYAIRTQDVFKDMSRYREDFDTSEYPPTNPCYDKTNAKVIGKFKDEACGRRVREFVGLMAKLYCVVIDTGDETGERKVVKRAKGVARGVVKHEITVDDYRRSLVEGLTKTTVNTRFQSLRHILCTVQVNKKSLSPNDDKRYIQPDGVHTLPWGHRAVPPEALEERHRRLQHRHRPAVPNNNEDDVDDDMEVFDV